MCNRVTINKKQKLIHNRKTRVENVPIKSQGTATAALIAITSRRVFVCQSLSLSFLSLSLFSSPPPSPLFIALSLGDSDRKRRKERKTRNETDIDIPAITRNK